MYYAFFIFIVLVTLSFTNNKLALSPLRFGLPCEQASDP